MTSSVPPMSAAAKAMPSRSTSWGSPGASTIGDAVVALGRRVVDVAQGDHQPGDHRAGHAADLAAALAHRLVALGLGGVAQQGGFARAQLLEPVGRARQPCVRLRRRSGSRGQRRVSRPQCRQTLLQCPDMETR